MTTYPLKDGDALVVSVDGTEWTTITFSKKKFKDISAATAQELIEVINATSVLVASEDLSGILQLETKTHGGHASLAVDIARSTAASALGLSADTAQVSGEGPSAAKLVGLAKEPFPISGGSEMAVSVDGKEHKIVFSRFAQEGKATAREVARAINTVVHNLARPSSDGRVMLTSQKVGVGSKLEVIPGRIESKDAATKLGFIGGDSISDPYPTRPAKLRCSGRAHKLVVTNLTANPVQLHFPKGTVEVPAKGEIGLAPGEAGHGPLQRLIEQGALRMRLSK